MGQAAEQQQLQHYPQSAYNNSYTELQSVNSSNCSPGYSPCTSLYTMTSQQPVYMSQQMGMGMRGQQSVYGVQSHLKSQMQRKSPHDGSDSSDDAQMMGGIKRPSPEPIGSPQANGINRMAAN